MKAIMCVEKIVKHGSDIVGNGNINDLRKQKNWNSKARRQRMFEKVKMGPERFISNYNWMLNEIGEKDSHKAIKAAICKLFSRPTLSQVTVFEKETGNRRSSDKKGMSLSFKICFNDVTRKSRGRNGRRVGNFW